MTRIRPRPIHALAFAALAAPMALLPLPAAAQGWRDCPPGLERQGRCEPGTRYRDDGYAQGYRDGLRDAQRSERRDRGRPERGDRMPLGEAELIREPRRYGLPDYRRGEDWRYYVVGDVIVRADTRSGQIFDIVDVLPGAFN